MLAIKGESADHDTQTSCQGLTLNYVSICNFFMGRILQLYNSQGLFIICSPDTDVAMSPYNKRILKRVTERKIDFFL